MKLSKSMQERGNLLIELNCNSERPSLIFLHMLYEVPQFGKDEFFAGKFAGLEAAGYAKDQGFTDNAGSCPGEEGGRVDFLIAQLAKKWTKGGKLFGKHGPDCLDSHISRADSRAPAHQDCIRVMLLDDRANRIRYDILVVGDHLVKSDFMLFLGPLSHPMSALVISKAAGGRYGYYCEHK